MDHQHIEDLKKEYERLSADGFRVFQQRYPAAGTPNAAVALGIGRVGSYAGLLYAADTAKQ